MYPTLVKTSIDYGVLEKAKNQIVVEAGVPVGRRRHVRRALALPEARPEGNLARGDAVAVDAQEQPRGQRREGRRRPLRSERPARRSHRRRRADRPAEAGREDQGPRRAGSQRRAATTSSDAEGGLPPNGAVLALDYGDARIGLAVSDPKRTFVFGRDTLERSSDDRDFAVIEKLCREESIGLVVVGLPLNADGTEGGAAKAARAYAAKAGRAPPPARHASPTSATRRSRPTRLCACSIATGASAGRRSTRPPRR